MRVVSSTVRGVPVLASSRASTAATEDEGDLADCV
jgi:hypothetical protein